LPGIPDDAWRARAFFNFLLDKQDRRGLHVGYSY